MALRGVYGGFRAKHRYITESKCVFLTCVLGAMVAMNNYKKQSFYVVTFEC